MPPIFLLRCALIGATTGLIIRIIMLFVKKQPCSTWPKPLLKTAISGALLGMAGGYAGYLVSTWVAGFSQHWLVLLLSAIIAAFIVGWILMSILERLVWRRLDWG
ncbi:MAG: hypothetical protein JEZ00_18970 [Anaerolineaceae bacterium]|nr:hypothetical protein [Anaerolineaceae bacterium]